MVAIRGVGSQDQMGKHIDAMVADLASTAQLARQGKLRVLATTAAKRVAGWEQTARTGRTADGLWHGGPVRRGGPKGAPQAAITRFSRDLSALLADKEVAERIATIGPIAEPGLSVEQVGAFLAGEHTRWRAITKEIGLLPE